MSIDREIDPIHVRLRGERARDIRIGNDAVLDQNIDHIVRAVERDRALVDLCARYESHVLEDIEHVIFVVLHLSANAIAANRGQIHSTWSATPSRRIGRAASKVGASDRATRP